jgi:hypothetical protein
MKSKFLALSLTILASSAQAGNSELTLAALVGLHSPHLSAAEKTQLEKYLDGDSAATGVGRFSMTAKAVTCRMGDVDITFHGCNLDFGTKQVALEGRHAHELYATLIENGVPSDGTAGTIYEAVTDLDCVIAPAEIKENAGGGASCKFKAPK